MSELPYTATGVHGGLYSIEEQEQFYEHFIDHENDYRVSAITNMIDSAARDIEHGLQYLDQYSSIFGGEATQFLDDTLHALVLSKSLLVQKDTITLVVIQPHTYLFQGTKYISKSLLKSNFRAFKFTLKVTYGFETSLRKIQDLGASVVADLLTEQQFITK